jgi:hypothetical protein
VDVIYMERLHRDYSEEDVVARIIQLYDLFRPDRLAHDYGGQGASKETLLLQAGIPFGQIIPFTYTYAPTQHIIFYEQAVGKRRSSYMMDKTRSLSLFLTAMRACKVRPPLWKAVEPLLTDLLQLRAENRTSPRRNDMICMIRKGKEPDDMAHSLNMLCASLWYRTGTYPQLHAEEENAPDWEEIQTDIDPPELDLSSWGIQ